MNTLTKIINKYGGVVTANNRGTGVKNVGGTLNLLNSGVSTSDASESKSSPKA